MSACFDTTTGTARRAFLVAPGPTGGPATHMLRAAGTPRAIPILRQRATYRAMNVTTERRNRRRIRVHWPIQLLLRSAPRAISSTTLDVSSDGFYCLCPEAFERGEVIRCLIAIPCCGSGNLRLRCRDPRGARRTRSCEWRIWDGLPDPSVLGHPRRLNRRNPPLSQTARALRHLEHLMNSGISSRSP